MHQERQTMVAALDAEIFALHMMALCLAEQFVSSRRDSALHIRDSIVHQAVVASVLRLNATPSSTGVIAQSFLPSSDPQCGWPHV